MTEACFRAKNDHLFTVGCYIRNGNKRSLKNVTLVELIRNKMRGALEYIVAFIQQWGYFFQACSHFDMSSSCDI